MISSWMVSLLFFTVSIVVLASGIFTLQSNYKAMINRVFFALTLSISIWSSGMALSTVATDVAASEIFRWIAASGWSTTYSIMLHFILILTDKAKPLCLKSGGSTYVFVCLPSCLFLPLQYQMILTLNSFAIDIFIFDQSIIRGIFVQIQMFLSIYLVLNQYIWYLRKTARDIFLLLLWTPRLNKAFFNWGFYCLGKYAGSAFQHIGWKRTTFY